MNTDIQDAMYAWGKFVDDTFRKAEWMWLFFPGGGLRIECFKGEREYMKELESGCGDWHVDGTVDKAVYAAIERWNLCQNSQIELE